VRVADFDSKTAVAKLKQAKVEVVASTPRTVTFKDQNGIEMEIQGHA